MQDVQNFEGDACLLAIKVHRGSYFIAGMHQISVLANGVRELRHGSGDGAEFDRDIDQIC